MTTDDFEPVSEDEFSDILDFYRMKSISDPDHYGWATADKSDIHAIDKFIDDFDDDIEIDLFRNEENNSLLCVATLININNLYELDKPIHIDFLDDDLATLEFDGYKENGSLAIYALNKDDELLSSITVNLMQSGMLDKYQFYLNDTITARSFKNAFESELEDLSMTVKTNTGTYHAYNIKPGKLHDAVKSFYENIN